MLDAVTTALGPKEEESPPSEPEKSAAPDPKVEAEKAAAEVKEEELSPEELKRLSVKAQARYRGLVETVKKAEARASELEPKAAQFDVITKQIRETGLDQADLNVGFGIMTAMKRGDTFGAMAQIEPIYKRLLELTGGVLPKDLADEVEAKVMPETRARELATARAAAAQTAQLGQRAAQEAEARQAQELTAGVVNAVNEWEKGKAATDPDWKLKSPLIMQALRLSLVEGNRPKTTQDAVKMAESALAEVERTTRAFRPAPKAIKAPLSSGVGASSRSQAQPKNMLDIVNAALG